MTTDPEASLPMAEPEVSPSQAMAMAVPEVSMGLATAMTMVMEPEACMNQ